MILRPTSTSSLPEGACKTDRIPPLCPMGVPLGSSLSTYLMCWAPYKKCPIPSRQAHYSRHPTVLAGSGRSSMGRDLHPTCTLSPLREAPQHNPASAQPAGSPTGTISPAHPASRAPAKQLLHKVTPTPPARSPGKPSHLIRRVPCGKRRERAQRSGPAARQGKARPSAPTPQPSPCWA